MVQPFPGSMELERWRSKERRNNKGVVCRMWKEKCYGRKSIRIRKERDLVSRVQNRKKEAIVELESGGTQAEAPKSIAKEEDKQRDIRRTFKILREVWLNIGVEKVDTHEGVTVKALLDSSITGMFIDKKMAAKHGFKL